MSPSNRGRTTSRRDEIERDLNEEYHVEWDFRSDVPLDEIDFDKSLHNQARFEALDETVVDQYTEAVERGDPFPAIVAYRPGRAANAKLVLVDGNHRAVAHQRAGKQTIDVYELDRTTKAPLIATMTFAFNTRHGRPTSEAERVSQAIYLIDNGSTQEGAAAKVNVPMRVLKRALAKANADKRADEVGADRREWEALSQAVKNRLLNITTDEGFHGAIHLAYAAQLGSEEVFELVTMLNVSKSGTKQKAIIKAETERHRERIQDAAGGVLVGSRSGKPMTPKARLGMLLGQVLALPDDLGTIARSYAEGERHDTAERLINASDQLRKLAYELEPDLR